MPPGATLLGIILSSDKTTISAQTGNRVAHPLLLSLANLDLDYRSKATNKAFVLIALLPVAKFLHPTPRICGVLNDRLFHECVDYVIRPLKTAAQIGVMMNDPFGGRRYCFTPLAAYIVDTPEAALIATVLGKTSPVTMAMYEQFGDDFQHPPRNGENTLRTLAVLRQQVDPLNVDEFFAAAAKYRLNGVDLPFWRDYVLSDPAVFLTPEPLHHWHKMFFDHDLKWCIHVVTPAEIDFRFSVLHPHVGMRHFKQGISKAMQVTGREHRDMQRYIIPVITGAVPRNFLIAVRSLLDFRYLAQAPLIDESTLREIEAALQIFHQYKSAIIAAKARRGAKNNAISNWFIPKLEFLQSVVSSIRRNGVAMQWSADITEHAHIRLVKDPARASNNQDYEAQICRHLDRLDKQHMFDLALSLHNANIDFRAPGTSPDPPSSLSSSANHVVSSSSSVRQLINTSSSRFTGPQRANANYFQAEALQGPSELVPRTFSHGVTAFHLRRDPHLRLSVDAAATRYALPDLQAALAEYLLRLRFSSEGHISTIGGRRLTTEKDHRSLPITQLHLWTNFSIQTKGYHFPHPILPPRTVTAMPIDEEWPHGRYDPVIANTDANSTWPKCGLVGKIFS